MLDHKIITFLSLCKTLSYTKSAQALHITQPAVSQHIKGLQEHFQDKLFTYQNKQLALTDVGSELYKVYTSLYINSQNIELLIKERKMGRKVKLGATKSIADNIMTPLLIKTYREEAMELEVIVDNTTILQNKLYEGLIDFALIEGQFNKEDFDYYCFRKESFIGVSCDMRWKNKRNVKIAELLEYPIILREEGSGTRNILSLELSKYNLSLDNFKKQIIINDFNTIKKFLLAQIGISFMFEIVAKEEIEKGHMFKIDVEDFSVVREFNLIYLKNNLKILELDAIISKLKS